jgi:hypothetical protein
MLSCPITHEEPLEAKFAFENAIVDILLQLLKDDGGFYFTWALRQPTEFWHEYELFTWV